MMYGWISVKCRSLNRHLQIEMTGKNTPYLCTVNSAPNFSIFVGRNHERGGKMSKNPCARQSFFDFMVAWW